MVVLYLGVGLHTHTFTYLLGCLFGLGLLAFDLLSYGLVDLFALVALWGCSLIDSGD